MRRYGFHPHSKLAELIDGSLLWHSFVGTYSLKRLQAFSDQFRYLHRHEGRTISGFEVVGVVLGAIPLVVSGLEHYADGVATIKGPGMLLSLIHI